PWLVPRIYAAGLPCCGYACDHPVFPHSIISVSNCFLSAFMISAVLSLALRQRSLSASACASSFRCGLQAISACASRSTTFPVLLLIASAYASLVLGNYLEFFMIFF